MYSTACVRAQCGHTNANVRVYMGIWRPEVDLYYSLPFKKIEKGLLLNQELIDLSKLIISQ